MYICGAVYTGAQQVLLHDNSEDISSAVQAGLSPTFIIITGTGKIAWESKAIGMVQSVTSQLFFFQVS